MNDRDTPRGRRGLPLLSALGLGLSLSLGAGAPAPATAQVPPARDEAQALPPLSSEQLIEALQPAEPLVRTRGLRNLVVRDKSSVPAPATADVAAPQGATPAPAANVPSVSLHIPFALDSSNLHPEGMAVLEQLAEAMRSPQLVRYRFRVEGHTDATANAAYNLQLSQARADEVRRFLVRRGVAAERLETVGKGAAEPANTADPFGPGNRRVRIVNLGGA